MKFPWRTFRGRAEAAESAAKVFWQSGLLPALRPAGWRAMAKAARGAAGPDVVFRIHGQSDPSKLAAVHGVHTRSYGELDGRIDRLKAGLRSMGVGRGDRVALCMKNRLEYLEALPALARLGVSTVNVSWRSTPEELVYLVGHSGAKVLLFESWLADRVSAALPQMTSLLPRGAIAVGEEVPGFLGFEEVLRGTAPVPRDEEGGAVIIYTSGTTGKPKGAVRKFPKEATYSVMHFLRELPFRTDDRHLVLSPLYHSAGFAFASMSFLLGATVVLLDDLDPESILRTIERERITTTMAVPTLLHRLVSLPPEVRRRHDTSSLRAVVSGAAPLSSQLARRFQEAFGPVLYNFYGATETGLVTIAKPHELLERPETIGRAVRGNHILLLDDEGNEVPPGEVGELFVSSPMIITGYHADEAATKKSKREHHFSVGDLARMDADGFYYIAGRKRDMIISGGVNIYPREIEDVLERHPEVVEAAVVGVSDEEWGETVRGFVALEPGARATPNDLQAYCRSHLANVKVPKEILVLDSLPRNPTGKILKTTLSAMK